MAGNVLSPIGEKEFPATPDMATLGVLQRPLVTVTKIIRTGSNKFEPQLIVNVQEMTLEDILALQDQLPLRSDAGPGMYRFEVTDRDSPGRCVWQTRLGSAGTPVEAVPATATTVSVVGGARGAVRSVAAPSVPMTPDADLVVLGNGYTYHRALHLLTVPDGRIMRWEPSQPLPDLVTSPLMNTSGPATSIGALPAMGGTSPEVDALRQEIARMQRERENEVRDREARDREAQLRQQIQEVQNNTTRALQDMASRFEATITKLLETPKGPSAAELKLQALETQLAEQKRLDDLQARNDAKFDSLMANFQALQANANKGPDPAINLLMQFLAQQQQSAAENLRAVREASTAQLQMAQQHALTPDKLLSMVENLKGGNELSSRVLESLGTAFDQVVRMQRMAAEMQGGGGGTNWGEIIQNLGGRIGGAVQAIAQYKSQEARTAEVKAAAQVVQARRQVAARQAQPAAVGPVPPAPAPTPPSTPAPAKAAEPVAAPVTPAEVIPPRAAEDGVGEMEEIEDETETESSISEEELRALSLADLRKVFNDKKDEEFFGETLAHVQTLREAFATNPTGHKPEEVAGFVHDAAQFFAGREGDVPLAIQLLVCEKYEYLIERLLPQVAVKTRKAIVQALRTAMQAGE